ncbi:MAG: GNAT family N-acetyltransferase [Flavobacteriales bacterium]|nr:GNAT family N-acetyltransferase [Flavobacteriales bacterium]
MKIRQVQESDNLGLAKMIRDVFEEYDAPKKGTVYSDMTTDALFELFQNKKSILYVAENSENILGCCGIFPTLGLPEHCAELVKFYLPKELRNKGIGKILLERCIAAAKQLGYSQLYIESLPHFSKAISMYEKQGFISLKNPLGESGHTSCNIWMLKQL